jgi:hypothetical protein
LICPAVISILFFQIPDEFDNQSDVDNVNMAHVHPKMISLDGILGKVRTTLAIGQSPAGNFTKLFIYEQPELMAEYGCDSGT